PDGPGGPKGAVLMERLEAAGLGDVEIKGVVSPLLLLWLEIVPLGAGAAVTPILRLTSRTVFKAAEECHTFAPFAGKLFSKREAVDSEDGQLDECPLSYAVSVTVASAEQTDSFVEYYSEVTLGRDPDDTYRKSPHTQIPLDHSLVMRLDDEARKY